MASKSYIPPLVQYEIKGEFNYLVPSRQLTKFDNVFIFSVRRNANLGGSTYIATGSSVIPGKGEPLSQAKGIGHSSHTFSVHFLHSKITI